METYKPMVLILGGCSKRGQQAAKRCIDQGYIVVVVDNTRDPKELPENWPSDTNCHDHKDFCFYEDDMINFLCSETFLSNVQWHFVFNYAKVKDPENRVNEFMTNSIMESVFFRWVNSLSTPKPQVFFNTDSLIGNYVVSKNLLRLS